MKAKKRKFIRNSIFFILITIFVLGFYLAEDDRASFINSFEMDGVIVERFESVRSLKKAKLRNGEEYSVVDISCFPSEFESFMLIGDSIYSTTGDSLIKVYRGDSTFVFQKFTGYSHIDL